jgi:RNA polymerase sigma factor (sigma-70 family)
MKVSGTDAIARDLGTLFRVGAIGGFTDGQLLERFVERREADAFEALVHRHGPMVWGVCRRVLRDSHDAEDAFQATFLVLARKAALVLPREKLGNWLFGVAYQTARKAKAMRDKRRIREGQRSGLLEMMAVPDDPRDTLTEDLDRELARLPENYCIPIVLCELEGMSHAEAAEQLGWPIGTVSSRLSRGRSLLARRLSRSGVVIAAGSLAIHLTHDAALASMPTRLVVPTTLAAGLFTAGRGVSVELVSADVVALTKEVLKAMLLAKLKVVAVASLIATAVGIGGLLHNSRNAVRADEPGKNLEKLQGIWSGVVAEVSGRPSTPSEDMPAPQAQVYIKGDRLTLRGPIFGNIIGFGSPVDTKCTFTADTGESKVPKALQLTLLPAPDDASPTVYQGLYWQSGDELVICLAAPNKKRPAKLRTEANTTQMLLKLKRDRATEWRELPNAVLQRQPNDER